MNRGLGAAGIAAAGLAAHHWNLPAGQNAKRARIDEEDDSLHTPELQASQDSQVPQSFGLGSFGSLGSMFDNSQPQFAAGNGGGDGNTGGGANQGGGPVPNTVPKTHGGEKTMTFKHCGSFHVSDNGQHNTWTPVPWEFPRLWIQNEQVKEAWKEYRWYRTKRVTIRLKNPYQRYRFTQATGNVNTHSDPNARLLVAVDDELNYGVPFYTDWQEADWNNFRQSTQFGGFNRTTNTAYVLPYAIDTDTIRANNDNMRYPLADFVSGAQEIQVGLGQIYEKTYTPSEKTWRSAEELVHSPGVQYNNSTVRQALVEPQGQLNATIANLANATTTYLIPWRADNYGCWKYNVAATGPTANGTFDLNPCWSMYRPDFGSGMSDINSATQVPMYYTNYYYPIPILLAQGHIEGGGNPGKARRLLANPCEEESPQPMMWISYRNMITNDGTSPMDQKILMDFEYEWEIELGGKINPKYNSTTAVVHAGKMPTQYAVTDEGVPCITFKRHPTLLGTTKWLAYPEYPIYAMHDAADADTNNVFDAHMPGGVKCWRTHSKILEVHGQPEKDPSKECE